MLQTTISGNHAERTVEIDFTADGKKNWGKRVFGIISPEKLRWLTHKLIERGQIPWTRLPNNNLFVRISAEILSQIAEFAKQEPEINNLIFRIRATAATIPGAELGAEACVLEIMKMPPDVAIESLQKLLAYLEKRPWPEPSNPILWQQLSRALGSPVLQRASRQ